ncbi:winged helix-turn-helix transcriptional regulator [Nocardia rhamnosiphila]|uniref:winged helix-turn-helix transcriptional regulator n=1 Tax=Nocardia rhamnosiphila TaxID=426716 RepID=UPI0037964272
MRTTPRGAGARSRRRGTGELERRITTVTPKVMTRRLGRLERDGLGVLTYHAGVPPRVE